MDKPIVADGNNGTAIDTSTGIVFNAVLSAPAGSKVVNPITTVINELIKGDATLKANYYSDDAAAVAAALTTVNGQIADAFGLGDVVSDTGGGAVDFTNLIQSQVIFTMRVVQRLILRLVIWPPKHKVLQPISQT